MPKLCANLGMASIYRRDKTWWIRYSSRGKDIRRSLKTTNRNVALRERPAIEAEQLRAHRRAPEEKNPLVDAFWGKYVEWATSPPRPGPSNAESTSGDS